MFLALFSSNERFVENWGRRKSLTLPTKSFWLERLVIPSSTGFIVWKAHILVPWKCLLFFSILSFVKIVTTSPLSFKGMTWLLFLYTCKALAAQSEITFITCSRRSKYQFGEVFEEAFYIKLMNTTSRKF